MNDQEFNRIVESMVNFIEQKEQDLLASKFGKGSQSQSVEMTKIIISKLEVEMKNEN